MNESASRRCGSCRACCSLLGVPSLGKKDFRPCPHLAPGTGTNCCSIYAERPAECRGFRCAWLQGVGSSKLRPDRCGMMAVYGGRTNGAEKVLVYSLKPGAPLSPRARRWIDRLSDEVVVILVEKENRRILRAPVGWVEETLSTAPARIVNAGATPKVVPVEAPD